MLSIMSILCRKWWYYCAVTTCCAYVFLYSFF